MSNHKTFDMQVENLVATITLTPPSQLPAGPSDLHWELGAAFSALRGENSIRVIVLTGAEGEFYVPRRKGGLRSESARRSLLEPAGAWQTFTGVLRTHQSMAEIEKPIVAKVNGDALGFGSSLVFASDIILAANDAVISDIHLALGNNPGVGPDKGIVPGDGGGALIPLFLSPPKAKEYLMLSKEYTGAALAKLGAINYAIGRDELDDRTTEIVADLLARPAYALAWTKRIVNRVVINTLNMTLDAGAAYEMVSLLQLERSGWDEFRSLS